MLAGEVLGDANATLTGFAMIDGAKPGDLTFAETEEFFAAAENSAATAIIADARFTSTKKILIRVPNARIAFAKALAVFFPEPKPATGIHPSAVVAASAPPDTDAPMPTASDEPRLSKIEHAGRWRSSPALFS